MISRRVILSGIVSIVGLFFTMEAAAQFSIPLRINMGGPEVIDSLGRTWLGDGFGPGDLLNIRPDDAGGMESIAVGGWFCGGSLEPLGFNSAHPGDQEIFGSIRWDNGAPAAPAPYLLEIPIPNGSYLVNLYFYENCCPGRHASASLEGVLVDPDISHGACTPGRRSFDKTEVVDGSLTILISACLDPLCPGGADANATLSAIEVVPSGCGDVSSKVCARSLGCSIDGAGAVTGTWDIGKCITYDGYELRRNGEKIQDLPGDASQFSDIPTTRLAEYELVPITATGEPACGTLRAAITNPAIPFVVPVRLNMGGTTVSDSKGRKWLGDGFGAGDLLNIRPNDTGGRESIDNWCAISGNNIEAFGFLPTSAGDRDIFGDIRWDNSGDLFNYNLELPIANGDYQVNLYFFECGSPQRHYQISIQGNVLESDVSMAKYQSNQAGRFSFDGINVSDGLLKISLPPFAVPCPAGTDCNAILSAIEVVDAGSTVITCPSNLVATADASNNANLTWRGPENVSIDGYRLYLNGDLIQTLPPDALGTQDASGCHRTAFYELEAFSGDKNFFCAGQRLPFQLVNPNCRFESPLRINMGSTTVFDSNGNIWFGDGPGADPLSIRPNDAGGVNVIADFVAGNIKPASYTALGFDASNANDRTIFNSIRWDNGGDAIPYLIELPVTPGAYDVNLYFNEGCCINRHYKIELEGHILDDDVSAWDFDPAADRFATPPVVATPGNLGKVSFSAVTVGDSSMSIRLLPCPTCFEPTGGVDTNPILNAIEAFHLTTENLQLVGDTDRNGLRDVTDIIGYIKLQFPGFYILDRNPPVLPCEGGLSSPNNLAVLDLNGDDAINLIDAVHLARHIFLGGPPPVQGPSCVVPPEPCAAHPSCQ